MKNWPILWADPLLEKAREAAENARANEESAAQDMFQFYANLLLVDNKYTWNKTIQEQTQSDPYTDLQGVSRKGPRGLLRKAFDDCVMFHLLPVFPNNAAEQERYCLTNGLKKSLCVSVRQFVQHVEQLNSYTCKATQLLHCAAAMLVQQPKYQTHHNSGE